MPGFFSTLSQFFPPKPKFTEKDLPDLRGKTYIVTGSNSGVGKEIARILYTKQAKVYIAARSKDKADKAIDDIKKSAPRSAGELVYLRLDLADLTAVKASAEEFLSKESKLHVLFNNAGVWLPPAGSKSVQGYELQLGVHNLGHFLFTKLLTPTLVATAKTEPTGTVRVIWVASQGAEMGSPKNGGVPLDNLDYHDDLPPLTKYCISKAGSYYQGVEYAKRYKSEGILSLPLNPGNLDSELFTAALGPVQRFFLRFLLYPPVNGAYTEIFAGFSPQVTPEKSGSWIGPFGRFLDIRKDLVQGTKTKAEGGSEIGLKFWEWTEEQIKPFL